MRSTQKGKNGSPVKRSRGYGPLLPKKAALIPIITLPTKVRAYIPLTGFAMCARQSDVLGYPLVVQDLHDPE